LSDALLANVVFFGSEQNKRVYIQLPTSADNVALPVLLLSAVLRRGCCWRPPLLINISCGHGAQQQTRRSSTQRANDGMDRQTDGQTDGPTDGQTDARQFHRPCCANCARSK